MRQWDYQLDALLNFHYIKSLTKKKSHKYIWQNVFFINTQKLLLLKITTLLFRHSHHISHDFIRAELTDSGQTRTTPELFSSIELMPKIESEIKVSKEDSGVQVV